MLSKDEEIIKLKEEIIKLKEENATIKYAIYTFNKAISVKNWRKKGKPTSLRFAF